MLTRKSILPLECVLNGCFFTVQGQCKSDHVLNDCDLFKMTLEMDPM